MRNEYSVIQKISQDYHPFGILISNHELVNHGYYCLHRTTIAKKTEHRGEGYRDAYFIYSIQTIDMSILSKVNINLIRTFSSYIFKVILAILSMPFYTDMKKLFYQCLFAFIDTISFFVNSIQPQFSSQMPCSFFHFPKSFYQCFFPSKYSSKEDRERFCFFSPFVLFQLLPNIHFEPSTHLLVFCVAITAFQE